MSFPALNGNWIDLIIFVVILFYLVDGWGKGFIRGAIDVVGFILSLIVALRFYTFAAQIFIVNFSLSRGIANALGFFLVASFCEFLLYVIAVYAEQLIDRRIIYSRVNRILGVIPSLLSPLILAAFILTTLITLPIKPDIKQDIVKARIGGFLINKTSGLERSVTAIFGGAIQDTLTFLTVRPHGDERVNLNFKATEYSVDYEAEQTMHSLVNRERQVNGLSTLSFDEPLAQVGRNHCKDMFVRGYFSHYTPEGLSPFDRMDNAGIIYGTAGENLAFAPTVEIAHTGLINSPGHRANILSPNFGKVGIGIINGGIYGRMFCQEFSN